jgi:hypothetical protein
MRSNLSLSSLLCLLLLAIDEVGVLAFSSARIHKSDGQHVVNTNTFRRQPLHSSVSSSSSVLHVATIDGSFFLNDDGFTNILPLASNEQQGEYTATKSAASLLRSYIGMALTGLLGNILLKRWAEQGIFSSYYPTTTDCTVADVASKRMGNMFGVALGAMVSLLAAFRKQAFGSSFRLFQSLSSWYLTQLEAAPLLTKCVTGGLIAYCGDYGAQWFEYKSSRSKKQKSGGGIASESTAASELVTNSPRAGGPTGKRAEPSSLSIHGTYDFRRGVARFLECLLISSPLMHYGYDLFERIVPVVGGTGISSSIAALSHVLADSVFLDGIFVGTGIVATGILEGNSLRKHVIPNLKNVYVPTLKASVMTSSALMPLQFLSFRFLPVQLRVLSVNAVDLIWTGVISFVSHSAGHEAQAQHAE